MRINPEQSPNNFVALAGRHAAHNNTNMPAQICQSSTRRYMRRRSAVPIHACRARKPECQLYRDISGRRNRCTRSTSRASRLSLVFTLPPYLPKSSARHGSNICDTLSLVHNTRTIGRPSYSRRLIGRAHSLAHVTSIYLNYFVAY